jgi:hypothetical protein
MLHDAVHDHSAILSHKWTAWSPFNLPLQMCAPRATRFRSPPPPRSEPQTRLFRLSSISGAPFSNHPTPVLECSLNPSEENLIVSSRWVNPAERLYSPACQTTFFGISDDRQLTLSGGFVECRTEIRLTALLCSATV